MLDKLILKQTIPIVESKIKKIIKDDEKKLGLDPRLKSALEFHMVNGEIGLQLINNRTVIKDYSDSEIKTNINELIAAKIKKVFTDYTELCDVDEHRIYFRVWECDRKIVVDVYVYGTCRVELSLSQLLLGEPRKI